MRIIIVLVIVIFLGQTFSCKGTEDKKEKDILVGVEYFNGWWERSPNKWEHQYGVEGQGKDWRANYPERIPLLGEYNSQETMDKEIKAAAEHGVDFFSILWYYPKNATKSEKRDVQELNMGVDFFKNSPNAHKMSFMIELCNHEPFAIETDEDWNDCFNLVIDAMKHPSYLKIDGKPVVKIHGGQQFINDNGSMERSQKILQRFRENVRNQGLGEIIIAVGAYGNDPIGKQHKFYQLEEVDCNMEYMQVPDLPQKETDYPYERLVKEATEVCKIREKDAMPFVPYFPAGWNPRPWSDPRPSFDLPNRKQWKAALEELKADLETSSNLGFPRKDGTIQKAFTIYAWNEYGEGGILAPTVGDKYMKLEEIKKVFGSE